MSEQATWSLIGPGIIGKELMRQVGQPEVAERLGLQPKPEYVIDKKGIWEADLKTPADGYNPISSIDTRSPQYHFIALPSSGDGETAMQYISAALELGKTVITAEKAALANHFPYIRVASDKFKRFGGDAAAGGGTRIERALRVYTEPDLANVTQIHTVINGTLAFMLSEIGPRGQGDGITRGQAVQQARKLGYAEPESITFEEVVHAEAEGDIPKKAAILFNMLDLGRGELLDWHDLKFELTDLEIARAVREARKRRFIVSFHALHGRNQQVFPHDEDIIGGFDWTCNGFQIVGGFQNVDHEPLGALGRITGPGNGALIGLGPNERDGLYHVGFGPGAGAAPTVNTMLDNYLRLRQHQRAG